jgi:hypothetical protein
MPYEQLPPDPWYIKYLLPGTVGATLGFAFKWMGDRHANRLLILKKRITSTLVGISSSSELWGQVEIYYNSAPADNLYFVTADIFNTTDRDAPENLQIVFSLSAGAVFVQQEAIVYNDDVSVHPAFEKNYFDGFKNTNDMWSALPIDEKSEHNPIWKELGYYSTHRIYTVPILNRKRGRATFTFLIGGVKSDAPQLQVGIYKEGIRLVPFETPELLKKRKKWNDFILSALFLGSVPLICHFSPTTTWAGWLVTLNIFIVTLLVKWIMKILISFNWV